jgi:hypothetical protein
MSKIQMCLEIEQAIKALNLTGNEVDTIRTEAGNLEFFHEALGDLLEDKIIRQNSYATKDYSSMAEQEAQIERVQEAIDVLKAESWENGDRAKAEAKRTLMRIVGTQDLKKAKGWINDHIGDEND